MEATRDIYINAGRVIQRMRRKRGHKQDVLARAAGLSRASISNIELGRQKLLLDTFYKIALALDCSPIDLLSDIINEKSSSKDIDKAKDPVEEYLLSEVINKEGGSHGDKK